MNENVICGMSWNFFYSFSTLCSSLTIDGMKATLAYLLHLLCSTQACTEYLNKKTMITVQN